MNQRANEQAGGTRLRGQDHQAQGTQNNTAAQLLNNQRLIDVM